jgi:tetratricopeptide (TPR) repeat protein
MDRGTLAEVLAFEGKRQQGIDLLQQGLALDPKNEDLLNFQVYLLAKNGDINGALAADDAYISVRPGDPNPYDTRGDALFMSGRDDDAIAAYRKAIELKPDFEEHSKLAIVYTDQKKPDMAAAAFQQFAQSASPLQRLYVPVYQAQFKQTAGDFEGALASYRESVVQFGRAGQNEAAGDSLPPMILLSLFLNETSSVSSFVRQQKLGGEELPAIAFLETLQGNSSASQQILQRYASSHPWIAPRAVELLQIYSDTVAAVQKGDGQTALTILSRAPNNQFPSWLFFRARAHQLTNDDSSAEAEFRAMLLNERSLENGSIIAQRFPAFGILSHYYLGQLYEHTGKRDQASNEYQEFLSHFTTSQSRLPQVAEARSALKRLIQ